MPDAFVGNSRNPTRRSFVKLAAATALVDAGGCANRAWSQPAPSAGANLGNAPRFDGEWLLDDAVRRGVASDSGGHVRRMPVAVLRPKSTDDIVRAVGFANRHGLKIAMRGQGHCQYGQAQVENGIVIDSATLNGVRLHESGFLDAQPGARWGSVTKAALAGGLIPPVLADLLALSVGGTLSVGGIGEMSHRYGAQVDNVLELDVVTGAGELMTCSAERNDELFHMVLAGLGQCGIIARARLRLIRAPRFVAMRALIYDELDSFLDDQSRLIASDSLGPMSGQAVRDPNGQTHFVLHAGSFVETANNAQQPAWMAGLRFKRERPPTIGPFSDFIGARSPRMGGSPGGDHNSARTGLVVTLPFAVSQDIIAHVLTNADAFLGIRRFEISARVTARHTMPLQKMPHEPMSIELRMQRFAVLAGAPDHLAMIAANHALLPKLQAVGGKVYPPHCPILSVQQWQTHYGAEPWQRFAAAKKRFDPNNVLTPGAGIF